MTTLRGYGRWRGLASFKDAVGYVLKHGPEGAPLAVWSFGVSSVETAAAEMTAVSSRSWAPDPIYHVILPWGPDEQPDLEQAKFALDAVLKKLGFDRLQYVAALANDGVGGLWHLHGIINRVDALTGHARAVPRGDWELMREAARDVERADGWRVVETPERSAFRIEQRGLLDAAVGADLPRLVAAVDGLDVVQSDAMGAAEQLGLLDPESFGVRGSRTNVADRYGMVETFKAFVRENVRPRLEAVVRARDASWDRWMDALDEFSLGYEVLASEGARIRGSLAGWSMVVSELGFDHRELVSRFGAWPGEVIQDAHALKESLNTLIAGARSQVAALTQSDGWRAVHEVFERSSLIYERFRNSGRIVEAVGPGWRRVDRQDAVLSFKAMTAKFGEFVGSPLSVVRAEARDVVKSAQEIATAAQLVRDPAPILQTLFHTRAMVSVSELENELERRLSSVAAREAVRIAVLDRTLAIDVRGTVQLTTREVVDEEAGAGDAAATLARRDMPYAISAAVPKALDVQQAAAFRYAVERTGSLKVITGVPGSGKTTLINSVAEAYRSAGYRLRGLAVANSAVEVLLRETTVPSQSIAKEFFGWDRQRAGDERNAPRSPLTDRDVLVVDEVGTCGTEAGRALLEEAARSGAVVVLFGDEKQFQAVARGDVLRIAAEAVGDRRVDLAKTRRQREPWMREASEALRSGDIRGGLTAYLEHGRIRESATKEGARASVIAEFRRLEAGGTTASIETYTNAERRTLNELARDAYRDMGRLEGSDVELDVMDGRLPFAVNDRVVVRERIRGTTLINGSSGVVSAIRGTVVKLERPDGKVESFDAREHPGLQHAYCSTEFREQGGTRTAELQLITRQVNQRSLTVGMTRHTHEYYGFYAREEIYGGFDGLVRLGERTQSKALVSDGRLLGRATEVLRAGRNHYRRLGDERASELEQASLEVTR